MFPTEKKSKQNHVKEWLVTLQEKFDLNEGESKKLFAITRICFGHNFDETRLQNVIFNFLKNIGRNPQMDEINSGIIFVLRAGTRKYEKWSWQGNAFGILAYLLTALFFIIDIIFPPNDQAMAAGHQFYAVLFVLSVWCLLDKCLRARPWTIILFNAVNSFMPGFTLFAYLFFHLCKMMYLYGEMGWILGMKVTGMAYVVVGVVLTLINLEKYRRVVKLEKIITF